MLLAASDPSALLVLAMGLGILCGASFWMHKWWWKHANKLNDDWAQRHQASLDRWAQLNQEQGERYAKLLREFGDDYSARVEAANESWHKAVLRTVGAMEERYLRFVHKALDKGPSSSTSKKAN